MITIQYARRVNGRHVHNFKNGREAAKHIELNRPDLFASTPNPDASGYSRKMREQRENGFDMNWRNKFADHAR